MKRVLLLVYLLLLILSSTAFANYYNNLDKNGNIIIVPLHSTVKGKSIPGARVYLNNLKKTIDNDHNFVFNEVVEGSYNILVEKEGYKPYKSVVNVGISEIIELGYITLEKIEEEEITSAESDIIDITDPSYLDSLLKKEEEESFFDRFKFLESSIDTDIVYLNTKYKKNNFNKKAEFNDNGYLARLQYRKPFIYDKYNLVIDLDFSYLGGLYDNERVYTDGNLVDTNMTSFSAKDITTRLSYDFDVDVGRVFFGIGRNYNSYNLELYSKENNIFSKENYSLKGFSFSGGYYSTFFENFKLKFFYEYIPCNVDIYLTDNGQDIAAQGNKKYIDLSFSTFNDFDLAIGYRYVKFEIEKDYDFESVFKGPYVSISIPF